MAADIARDTITTDDRDQDGWVTLAQHALQSYRYGVVQAPISAVVQLYDKVTDTDHLADYQIFPQPTSGQVGSAAWFGNLIGGTSAAAVQLGAMHRLVGAGAAANLERSAAYGLGASLPSVGKSVATGIIVGGFLSPVDNELKGKDFVNAKIFNAAISGANFGLLTAGAIGLKSMERPLLANDVVANALAGVPVGFIDSDLRSLASHGHLSSWTERTQSIANFTVGGAMAGGANLLHEHLAPTTGIRGVRTLADMKRLADSTMSPNHPKRYSFDETFSHLPRAEELLHTEPSEWYHQTTKSLREDIDQSHMPTYQKKVVVSGFQEFAYALDAISNRSNNTRPIMTIYGSARIQPDSFEYQLIRYIAGRAVHEGYDVQSGGGPGIMEAANRGAFEALSPVYDYTGQQTGWNGSSIGVVIKLPFEQGGTNGTGNGYQTLTVKARNFYTRAEILNQAGPGGVFVVGAGGVGTAAEGLNTVTQLQTGKMLDAPVFLVGKNEWRPLDNVFKSMENRARISPGDRNLYQMVDDPALIFSALRASKAAASKDQPAQPAQ